MEEIIKRDEKLRSKILKKNKLSYSSELRVAAELLMFQDNIKNDNTKQKFLHKIIKVYAYIYEYEWDVIQGQPNYGKGDLVFTDGEQNFLIVECKNLPWSSGRNVRTKRTQKRKKVKEQVEIYMKDFRQKHPDAKTVEGLAYCNKYEWYFFKFTRDDSIAMMKDSWEERGNELLKDFFDD